MRGRRATLGLALEPQQPVQVVVSLSSRYATSREPYFSMVRRVFLLALRLRFETTDRRLRSSLQKQPLTANQPQAEVASPITNSLRFGALKRHPLRLLISCQNPIFDSSES